MGSKPKIAFLSAVGTISVGLGILGVFVPLLPTTPFLLLAAFCFARSSPRFYQQLIGNRWLGDYVQNYRDKRGLPLRIKCLAIASLWITVAISAIWATDLPAVRVILLAVAVAVTWHLLAIRTLSGSWPAQSEGS